MYSTPETGTFSGLCYLSFVIREAAFMRSAVLMDIMKRHQIASQDYLKAALGQLMEQITVRFYPGILGSMAPTKR